VGFRLPFPFRHLGSYGLSDTESPLVAADTVPTPEVARDRYGQEVRPGDTVRLYSGSLWEGLRPMSRHTVTGISAEGKHLVFTSPPGSKSPGEPFAWEAAHVALEERGTP
jgi:hypothetical protein